MGSTLDIPAHCEESERIALYGCVSTYPQVLKLAFDELKPELFHVPENRSRFLALQRATAAVKDMTDEMSVVQALKRNDDLKHWGDHIAYGDWFLAALNEPGVAHIESHVHKLKNMAERRKASEAAELLGRAVADPDNDLEGVIDSTTKLLRQAKKIVKVFPTKAAPPAPVAVASGGNGSAPAEEGITISNFTREKNSEGEIVHVAMPMIRIVSHTFEACGGWPRRCDQSLFVDHDGEIRLLRTPEELFAWLGERATIQWLGGMAKNDVTLTPKAEFAASLRAVVENYVSVEELPHEPIMDKHYYAWRPPADYKPDGKALEGFLKFFDNPEMPEDSWLIRAAVLTPAWGGLPGTRPAFAILKPDRGCGASTLADAIGELYGGAIEIEPDHRNEDRVVQRLLSESALTRRVVRVDNVKASVASSLIENIITSTSLSGHRLYHGEARRPNTLTFFVTGNGLRLSRDMAERAFIIRLVKPTYRAEWRSELFAYITKHRQHILADVIQALKAPAKPYTARDRWDTWVAGVLTRCADDVDNVVKLTHERRDVMDDDLEEAEILEDAMDLWADKIMDTSSHVFISSTDMTKVVNDALNVQWSAKKIGNLLQMHIESGRLTRVLKSRTMSAKGYQVKRQNV